MKKTIIFLFVCISVISCTADDTQKQPVKENPIGQEDPKTPKSIGEYVLGTEITSKKGIYAVQGDSLNRIDIMYKYALPNQNLRYGSAMAPNELEETIISKTTTIISQHGIDFLQQKLRFYPIISNTGGKMIISSCVFNYDLGTNNITIQNDNWKGWDRIYLDFSNKGYITQWSVSSGHSLPKASWPAYHITYYY